jgi:hypothetical protein
MAMLLDRSLLGALIWMRVEPPPETTGNFRA